MRIRRSIGQTIRVNPNWDERWEKADKGLITCWECGRERKVTSPEESALASKGELLILPWKGGVDKAAKNIPKAKVGSLYYLAMWQGLRGDDLDIDTETGAILQCAATGVKVTYVFDLLQLAKGTELEEE